MFDSQKGDPARVLGVPGLPYADHCIGHFDIGYLGVLCLYAIV
jgi:hypothetical protein